MRLTLVLTVVCSLLQSGIAFATDPAKKDISALLAPVIQENNVPGMAAAVIQSGEVVSVGAAGVRTRGKLDKVTVADQFHIGSDTKAMTAMLCGILVDEGKLKWDQTIGETFPELSKTMDSQYRAVTLEQLLTNRGGAPEQLMKDNLWARVWQQRGTPTEARHFLLTEVTAKPPEAAPGEKFIYSNAGFSIAGHMAEKVMAQPWEDLIRERIFVPLKMTNSGFGAPGTSRKNDQPRGHEASGIAIEPDSKSPPSDNPVAIGPAGSVHCSIEDWARFVAVYLPSSKTKLVKPETLTKLQTPVPGPMNYAMGWSVLNNQPWARGPALTHSGSNTMWYAVAWIAPKRDFSVLVACNQANPKACNDAVLAIIGDHFTGAKK